MRIHKNKLPSKQQKRHSICALQLTSKSRKNPFSTIYVLTLDSSNKFLNNISSLFSTCVKLFSGIFTLNTFSPMK